MAEGELKPAMAEKPHSPLQLKISWLIDANGPMSLADYMHLCLADPDHGYYTTRDTIGDDTPEGGGDFITAPEISQMFGELIGIWCISAWQALDRPSPFTLAEAGPGKGTLMKDLLRAAAQMPGFCDAGDIHLIETSTKLIEIQQAALESQATSVRSLNWGSALSDLPDRPAIIIANEFLDAIPFRQYVKTNATWQEIGIVIDGDGSLSTGAMAATLDPVFLPQGANTEPEGAVFEHAPAREAVVEQMATHIACNGGAALLIDYGHLRSGFGDTFPAVRRHKFADPLAKPC